MKYVLIFLGIFGLSLAVKLVGLPTDAAIVLAYFFGMIMHA